MINEHGVLDTNFMISISLYKQKHGNNPSLKDPKDNREVKKKISESEIATETDFESFCSRCSQSPVVNPSHNIGNQRPTIQVQPNVQQNLRHGYKQDIPDEDFDGDLDEEEDDDNGALGSEQNDSEEEIEGDMDMDDMKDVGDKESVQGKRNPVGTKQWAPNSFSTNFACYFCNEQFRKDYKLKLHLMLNHKNEDAQEMAKASDLDEEEDDDNGALGSEQNDSEEEIEGDMDMDDMKDVGDKESVQGKRNPVGTKQWAPNSFSTNFACYFCNEQFRKDYKLKLYLMLNHKNEDAQEMAKATDVFTNAKLDGCIHECTLCGSKYNSVADFTRHIKDAYQLSRAQYTEEYGSSEVVKRMFKCELCDKEVKHSRSIIGAHMKLVHLISWKEYQDILMKMKQGINVGA